MGKTLIIKERRVSTAEVLCFNYNKSYTLGHKCKVRLLWMDVDGDCLVEMIDMKTKGDTMKDDTGLKKQTLVYKLCQGCSTHTLCY